MQKDNENWDLEIFSLKNLEFTKILPIFAASEHLFLTTPLSAGSKTLSTLLHLKATFRGGFYFSYLFRNTRLKSGLCTWILFTGKTFFPLNISTSKASRFDSK